VIEMHARKKFAREFKKFYKEIKQQVSLLQEESVIQLFAIYCKDLRTQKLLESKPKEGVTEQQPEEPEVKNPGEPATAKQKWLIKKLCEENDLDYDPERLATLTKEMASKIIKEIRGW